MKIGLFLMDKNFVRGIPARGEGEGSPPLPPQEARGHRLAKGVSRGCGGAPNTPARPHTADHIALVTRSPWTGRQTVRVSVHV